jgi:O-antigen/teichoic acid export membrane protein
VLGQAATFVLVAFALWSGFGTTGVVVGTALGPALAAAAMMISAARIMRAEGIRAWWNAPMRPVVPLLGELGASFGWSYVSATMGAAITQLPVMILGRLRGPEEAGFYRIASSIMTVGQQMEASLNQVAYPALASGWGQRDRRSLRTELWRWTLWPGLPAGAIVLLAIPTMPFLLPLVLGSGYTSVAPGAQIMMIGVAAGVIAFWLNAVYLAGGKFGLRAGASILHAVFVTGLGWIVGARWGFIGLAGLASAGKVLSTIWLLSQMPKVIPRTSAGS